MEALVGSAVEEGATTSTSVLASVRHTARQTASTGRGQIDRRKPKKDLHALPGTVQKDASQVVNPEQVIPLDDEDLKSF